MTSHDGEALILWVLQDWGNLHKLPQPFKLSCQIRREAWLVTKHHLERVSQSERKQIAEVNFHMVYRVREQIGIV